MLKIANVRLNLLARVTLNIIKIKKDMYLQETSSTSLYSTRLCSHGQKPKTRGKQKPGANRGLVFLTQASWFHSQVKLLYSVSSLLFCKFSLMFASNTTIKRNEYACVKSKLTRVRPRFVFTRVEPTSGTGVRFNPGRTRASSVYTTKTNPG